MSQLGLDLARIIAGVRPATEPQLLQDQLQQQPQPPEQSVEVPIPAPPGAGADVQLDRFLNLLPAAIYLTDTEGHITYYNDAAAALWGCRPRLNSDQWCGSWRLFWPDGRPMPHDTCPMAVALKERREIRGAQAIAERPDGTRVPFMAFPTPLYDEAGHFIGAVNMLADMRERHRAELVSRRLAAIVESSDDAIVSKDLNGIIATWNKGAERLFGYLEQEVVGKSITIVIPAELQDEETRILSRIRRGERIEPFETTRRRKDGSLISVSITVSPVTDEFDITEQKRKEEQINLLAREADHRTKNLLALAQAAVHLTNGESAAELKAAIEGRLRALANAHALLAQSRWSGANLRNIALDELAPYLEERNTRARIEGPDIMLEQAAAQAMALALHELSTNSVKYGALSAAGGGIAITWRREFGGRLSFRWSETGGPPVNPPSHSGFGTRIMTRICEQLNGEIKFDWRPEGLVCEIAIEL